MRKYTFGLTRDLILKSKATLLNKDMHILKLVVYFQQVKEEKKEAT